MIGGIEDAMASAEQKGQIYGDMIADNKKNNQAVRNRRKQIPKEEKRPTIQRGILSSGLK